MEPVTLRVAEARELLSLLPHRLGFAPEESAVVVSLRPPRGEVGLVARVDLAGLGRPEEGGRLARTLVGHLGRDGAAHALLVLYVPEDPRTHRRPDVVAAVAVLRGAAEPVLGEVPCWVVAGTGYLSLDCTDPACCPPGGRPLRELESTQVGATMVVAGSVVLASRDEVGVVRPAPGEARRATARARRRAEDRRAAALAAPGTAAHAVWRSDTLAAWRRLVDATEAGRTPAPPDLGRVEAGLTDATVRDAVLVTFVPGTGDLAERTLAPAGPARDRGEDDELGRALSALVDPVAGVRPPGAAAALVRALEAVVAHGRRGAQAPARTLLALLAWWHGDGVRAAAHVDAALADDPAHGLALLLRDVGEAGLPPGWARRERSARVP
ncbi:DUF4192 domain-containing protein [Cellulomonas marina]|uniref:DUF4192 domain-containing protein n=1 Tax=Cellulomonas marina TaxID=988821 RepID=A0A1I0W0Y6_9CELL|nr:DUF4192 domain-containing protein [Cellulomonas marina]GIG27407.1 hypothetical protein Cma02nite_00070 [Cellulomonas marina]SFA82395.1 protein of unknown function [Cellulomonas marina]